ncbi:alpha/beta hydrolase [Jannaschia aquimarina]|nr:alpha/beta hydrolase [Jannaschia aquimarina]
MILLIVAGFGLLLAFVLWRLADHDLDRRASEPFAFDVGGSTLAGTLWLPYGPPEAAVVLVHGDGPQDRTGGGGYPPLVNLLLDRGIAVASWDKPGVGASEGDWLDQSMADRTAEARAALAVLRGRLEGIGVGALGFSQAGWVLPALGPGEADFLVLIGPAVSWQAQGDYYTRVRLRRAGASEPEITEALAREAAADAAAFGPAAGPQDAPEGMTPARWRFVRTNRDADANKAFARSTLPILAIWGVDDLNVDAEADAAAYRALVGDKHPATEIRVVPDATHALLKSGPYNWQLAEDWPWHARARFALEGRYAFAPGALRNVVSWIKARGGRHNT